VCIFLENDPSLTEYFTSCGLAPCAIIIYVCEVKILQQHTSHMSQIQSTSTDGALSADHAEINSCLQLLSAAYKASCVTITPIGPNGRYVAWQGEPDQPSGTGRHGQSVSFGADQALRSSNIPLWVETCGNAIRAGLCTVKVLYHGKAITAYVRHSSRKTASLSISFQMPQDNG
jgi:hypothetical protein